MPKTHLDYTADIVAAMWSNDAFIERCHKEGVFVPIEGGQEKLSHDPESITRYIAQLAEVQARNTAVIVQLSLQEMQRLEAERQAMAEKQIYTGPTQ